MVRRFLIKATHSHLVVKHILSKIQAVDHADCFFMLQCVCVCVCVHAVGGGGVHMQLVNNGSYATATVVLATKPEASSNFQATMADCSKFNAAWTEEFDSISNFKGELHNNTENNKV